MYIVDFLGLPHRLSEVKMAYYTFKDEFVTDENVGTHCFGVQLLLQNIQYIFHLSKKYKNFLLTHF